VSCGRVAVSYACWLSVLGMVLLGSHTDVVGRELHFETRDTAGRHEWRRRGSNRSELLGEMVS
jgi:hypothetical protein